MIDALILLATFTAGFAVAMVIIVVVDTLWR